MNSFRSKFGSTFGYAVIVGAVLQLGCSSEEPPAPPSAGKVSRREEAGKKFPFPDCASNAGEESRACRQDALR